MEFPLVLILDGERRFINRRLRRALNGESFCLSACLCRLVPRKDDGKEREWEKERERERQRQRQRKRDKKRERGTTALQTPLRIQTHMLLIERQSVTQRQSNRNLLRE